MKNIKKKKILFVDHDIELSGSTISMSYLIKEFIQGGFKVLVLTKINQKGLEYLIEAGAEIIPYSSSPFKSITLSLHFSDKTNYFSFNWFKNLYKDIIRFFTGIILSIKIIYKYKPDLIYLNEYVTIQFSIFAKLKSIPVFVQVRSLFINQKYNLRIMLLKKALRKIPDYIFAITELEAKQINILPSDKTKVEIIPEFLFDKDFIISKNIEKIKSKYEIKNSEKVVSFLGGIKYIKGSIDFISAIEHISENLPKTKFILAGKIFNNKNYPEIYSYYKKCEEYLNKKQIKPFIKVIGETENVLEILSISDIVVSCSIESHFSRPIIEAWALKKAVIATDIVHSSNLIESEIDGILIPKNNPIELAKAIIGLFKNENLRKELGENGFIKASKVFSGNRNAEKIVSYCTYRLTKN